MVRLLKRLLHRLLILGLGILSVWLIVFVFRFTDRRLPSILALALTYGIAAYVILPRAVRMGLKIVRGNWWGQPSSGNRAFDDYRAETLRRLEDEQREFKEFLKRLRVARDRAEFDQFMNDRHLDAPSASRGAI